METRSPPRVLAAATLVIGALLGMAGTFETSVSIRSLAWGIDGTLLVVGAGLLAIHYLRLGQELVAAGFLVFLAGETLIVSGSAMIFAGGTQTPLSRPLPFFAYPFLALTLFGWAATPQERRQVT